MNKKTLIIALAAMGISAPVLGQNLIENGSFEEPAIGDFPIAGCTLNSGGGWFFCESASVSGWTVTKLDGQTPYNLEFQTETTLNVAPTHGLQYAELASHPGGDARVIISQEITVPYCSLDTYTLSFSARKRQGNDVLKVDVDGQIFTPPIGGEFTEFKYVVSPASDSFSIAFKEAGSSGTLGSLLDDVQLVADQEISNCQVAIDIKFCSDPNAFNCRKKGVLPVTIFGTEFFDVNLIDFDTVQLCLDDDVCTMEPLVGWSFMDRGQPGDAGAAECAWSECPAEEALDYDPSCVVEELDYLNPDFYDDVDVAFSATDVQEYVLPVFCEEEPKGKDSDGLFLRGELLDGSPIYSEPVPESGVDILRKANK